MEWLEFGNDKVLIGALAGIAAIGFIIFFASRSSIDD